MAEQSSKNLDERLKKALLILGWMAIVVVAFLIFQHVKGWLLWILNVLSPFLVALVLAYLFNPIVTFVQRKMHLGRITGVVVCVALVALMLVVLLAILIPLAYVQLAGVIKTAQEVLPGVIEGWMQRLDLQSWDVVFAQVQDWLSDLEVNLDEVARKAMPALPAVAEKGAGAAGQVVGLIAGLVRTVIAKIVFLVFVIIIGCYYLFDFAKIPGVVKTALPGERRDYIWNLIERIDRAVGGFLRGQLLDAACVGVLYMIALLFVGLGQYAVLIGLIAGAVNIIPYLGPTTGLVLSLLGVFLGHSDASWATLGWYALAVFLIFVVIQAIEGFVFQPLIVGRNAQLHPLAVFLALVVGAEFGIVGMIVAVPLACILRVLIKEFWWDKQAAAYSEGG